jgi:hypothetical protein
VVPDLKPLDLLAFDDVPVSSRYQRSDILAWLLAEYVCQRLEVDFGRTIQIMRQTFERFWREPCYLAPDLVERWDELLGDPPQQIVETLRRDDDSGAHMRQIVPAAGLITEDIRQPLVFIPA